MSTNEHTPPTPLTVLLQAPDYGPRVTQAIENIHRAKTVQQVLEMLCSATNAIGAQAGIYAIVTPEDESHQTMQVLLACDPSWVYENQRAGPIERHPWLEYAKHHERPILSSHLSSHSDKQAAAIDIAQQGGFRSTLVVPTPSAGALGRFGLLCLGSDRAGELESDDLHLFRLFARSLAMELYEWFAIEARESLLRSSGLRERDLELLTMERRGLVTKEIARTMGMSVDSVNSQFQRVKARLACPTRKAAARRAAEYGLI